MTELEKLLAGLSPEQRELFLLQLNDAYQTVQGLASGPTLAKRPDPGSFPLSFAQQRLWFIEQLDPGTSTYNLPSTIRLIGRLNVQALEQSLAEVVRRQEALRATFRSINGEPVQVIAPAPDVILPIVDLEGLPDSERDDCARALAARAARCPFDLTRGPLLRVILLRLSEKEHVLLVTLHHIVADGWSMGVLVKQVAACYDAFCAGRRPMLPELPLQYADFAHWQRQWLQGDVSEAQLSYWKRQLGGDLPLLELPTDHPRLAVQSSRGARHSLRFPRALVQALDSLSRKEGSTLFMTLLAAFQTLLHRYTGQDDILVGTPIANRTRIELEHLIGFFVNTLVIRSDLSGDPTFRELLARVRVAAQEAYAHQDLPFDQLVEALQPARDLSHSPVFQVMFVLQNTPFEVIELPGLALQPVDVHSGTSKFDLLLQLYEDAGGIGGSIEYNADLFEASTIARWAGHFRLLLDSIVANPERPVSRLSLLPATEQRQLAEWNQTRRDYPQSCCVHQLFEMQVEKTPETVAVSFGESLTSYAELNARANRLAESLRARGVGPDSRVGLCLERSLEMVVAVLGVLKAGGAYVPLDPAYPPERLAFMLDDARVQVLLTQTHLIARLPEHKPPVLCLDSGQDSISDGANLPDLVTPDNFAYVIYTSGSTGKPKGVAMTHRPLINLIAWQLRQPELSRGAKTLQFASMSFDVSFQEIFSTWCSGGTLVLISEDARRDPSALLHLLVDQAIERLFLPYVALQHLAETARYQQRFPESLMDVITAGEQLRITPEIAYLFGRLPHCRLHNHYGPSESHVVTALTLAGESSHWPALPSIGAPIANTQMYVLDSSLGCVPIGVAGELYIGGAGLARGYLDRPDLTAERFVPNPFTPPHPPLSPTSPMDGDAGGGGVGTRIYKTGDLARFRPDGQIEFLGRVDQQLKVRGFRIEPGEIEAALKQHPQVRAAVVVARREAPGSSGSGSVRLVAYVVTDSASESLVGELPGFLKETLPAHMVPAAFVMLDHLPLTPSGKVDRRALQLKEVPETASPRRQVSFAAPRTPLEETLANLWTQLLNVEPIGVHDNFFDLGGHSLLATQLLSRMRDVLLVELPLRLIFEAPTIAALADRIQTVQRAGDPAGPPPLQAVGREGRNTLPLSFAQQRLWFLDQLEQGSAAYNIPMAVRLNGRLNVEAACRSLNEIVRRHEILRTTFAVLEGGAAQVIASELILPLPVVDLRAAPADRRDALAHELARAEAQRPFGLARGPLLRASLLRLDDEAYLMLLTMHHIISDGWSMEVVFRELAALYAAFSQGHPSPLAELPLQYADFAVWQQEWLRGEVLESQLSYWRRVLSGAPEVTEVPSDRPRPAVRTFHGAAQSFALPADLSARLRRLGRHAGATLFMTVLAAFQVLLYRHTGQADVVVGIDAANRNRSEVEPLIGFFVNQLVLRADMAGNPSFRELLARVRSVVLEAHQHQDLPFQKIVEALRPRRSGSHTPLFQIKINFQNAAPSATTLPGLSLELVENPMGLTKYDLTLFLWDLGETLVGKLEYSTELFDPPTIARFVDRYVTLMNSIAAEPDARLDSLEMLTESERRQLVMEKQAHEQSAFKRFKAVKPKTVSLPQGELVKLSTLQPGQPLPLVIEPAVADLDLADWSRSQRAFIDARLLEHGAILFRGFNIATPPAFEAFAQTLCNELYDENGEHPHVSVSGKVYTPVFYPPSEKLLWHNENSFNLRWPLRIWFCCARPAEQGGETPLVDSRRVFEQLDPALREPFLKKGILYVRNYGDGLGLTWQEVFGTANKAEVEAACRSAGMECEWKEGDRLRTRCVRPAAGTHPQTGEQVWFNQAQHWHISCLDPDTGRALRTLFSEEDLPRSCYYGDGSAIEDSAMREILNVYQKLEVSFPWQTGDVVMVDNMLAAHGRNPFVGERKILVAMGDMISAA